MSQAAVAKVVKGVSGGNTATLLTSYDRPARVQCSVVLKTQGSRNVNESIRALSSSSTLDGRRPIYI